MQSAWFEVLNLILSSKYIKPVTLPTKSPEYRRRLQTLKNTSVVPKYTASSSIPWAAPSELIFIHPTLGAIHTTSLIIGAQL
ncbi:hypothetical protein Lal_00049779 [Lupinus albus]|nr:hypothetical protein Lal_00049779 [Lupinus albus]